ncbi:hypothetical protein [Spirosoma agri]|uniref:Uncharacterized protein n=1 Tax=Spirosoma agri TaxID=1987381 RepID=A0A6M0ISL8_9BACT|nr:hypothetical protein [Spirosoma agri]NEU70491.1 hypothetical protein [Spirosoma agri]
MAANQYSTNLHIDTNSLRAVRPTDKAILILFGYGHVPDVKPLFASNPASR